MKKVFVLVLAVIVSACSTLGPIYENVNVPNDGSSLLFVYRPSFDPNKLISPGILIDGEEKCILKNGGYIYFAVAEGFHSLDIKLSEQYSGSTGMEINSTAGEKNFVRLTTSYYRYEVGPYEKYMRTFSLEEVSESLAIDEIVNCRHIDIAKTGKFKKSHWIEN